MKYRKWGLKKWKNNMNDKMKMDSRWKNWINPEEMFEKTLNSISFNENIPSDVGDRFNMIKILIQFSLLSTNCWMWQWRVKEL